MRSWDAELQSSVKGLRVDDLKELRDNEDILSGLKECLPPATTLFREQQQQAQVTKDRAAAIKQAISDVIELHANVSGLQKTEDGLRSAWHSAKEDMYSATEPYSYVGISKRIERDIKDSAATTDNVEKRFMHPELKPDEAFVLAKRFLDAQQQLYVKQNMLHSMK